MITKPVLLIIYSNYVNDKNSSVHALDRHSNQFLLYTGKLYKVILFKQDENSPCWCHTTPRSVSVKLENLTHRQGGGGGGILQFKTNEKPQKFCEYILEEKAKITGSDSPARRGRGRNHLYCVNSKFKSNKKLRICYEYRLEERAEITTSDSLAGRGRGWYFLMQTSQIQI